MSGDAGCARRAGSRRRAGRRPLAIAAAIFAGVLADSAARGIEEDTQQWSTAEVSVRFAERYSANLLVELRFEDDISQLGTLIARPWLAVRPVPWLDLAVGYDYIPRFEPISVDQHVVWEQVALSRGFGRLDIDNRFRFEQRFIEHVDEVALRIRNRIRVTHPLGETRWYAVGQDEIFFQLNTLGPVIRSGFAENRVFVGLGRRLGDHAHIEAGYRLRYIDVPVLDDVIQHVIGISFGFDAELP